MVHIECGPHCPWVGCLRCVVTHIPDEWLSSTEPGLQAGSRFSLHIPPLSGGFIPHLLINHFRFEGHIAVFKVVSRFLSVLLIARLSH